MLLKVCRIFGMSAARIIAKVEEAGPGDRP
jgi:hypothetical protein